GFAIMFSGFFVPLLNESYVQSGWRLSWVVLAAIVLLVAITAGMLIRNDPAEKGLNPVGQTQELDYDPSVSKGGSSPLRILTHLGGLYAIFGATYV
ncbi:MAG: glucose-6-phosphate exchanger SLC37A4, partial [Gammaproteobacteria bacterium]|nr:glucose-6-phosphate exchanger SLC37A4 [Gammaproteobacteria bacterium]NIR94249.1 glucose-6-phosphate exchanger SLC37A4 [Gammaproteobacteria bacterium]